MKWWQFEGMNIWSPVPVRRKTNATFILENENDDYKNRKWCWFLKKYRMNKGIKRNWNEKNLRGKHRQEMKLASYYFFSVKMNWIP